jgi:hypothetical protein
MTESSDRKDSRSQQLERGASASCTPSEPEQLDLFESLERLTGLRWRGETACESKSGHDLLPPSSTLAAESKPSDSSRASAKPASAPSEDADSDD